MKKVFFVSLIIALLSINVVLADSGYYSDSFRPTDGHKVRTNPIGQWFDDQVNKSYVQKKNQPTKTNLKQSTNNAYKGYGNTNYNNQPQKPVVKSTGGWSS